MTGDNRYHIFKDGVNIGSTATREQALFMVRSYQELETHPFLKANFSIIYGVEEHIWYKK